MIQHDEWLSPEDLALYTVHGMGGSDMTAAMEKLAKEPGVSNAVVITDGYIDCPQKPMPYDVLWVISPGGQSCADYGSVIRLPHSMVPATLFDLDF